MTKIVTKLDTILDALEDALVERLMSRLATEGASAPKETYTPEELAARYGMSKSSINRRIRAGEFGETINTGPRTHLVTAAGLRQYEEAHTGPAHDGKPVTRTTRRRSHRDPGPILL